MQPQQIWFLNANKRPERFVTNLGKHRYWCSDKRGAYEWRIVVLRILGGVFFVSGLVAACVHGRAGRQKMSTAGPLRSRRRPYRVECTGSLSTSEVKRHRVPASTRVGDCLGRPQGAVGFFPKFPALRLCHSSPRSSFRL